MNEIKGKVKLSNMWQTIIVIGAIFAMGFTMSAQLSDAIFTEDEVKTIAREAASEVVYQADKEEACEDANDFIQGWIESSERTMEQYIQHAYENKTRVYKGGLLMIENEYDTRQIMSDKYGQLVVNDLVQKLIKFNR